jgi:hypothetical protein
MPVNEETACDTFEEKSATDPAGTDAATGAGGSDMASWSSDSSIINNLLAGNYSNGSSFSIPATIYEGAATDTFEEESLVDTSGTDADVGSGGGNMSAWDSKTAILNTLLAGSFTNKSSFAIPVSVFGSGLDTFEEAILSEQITADFRDVDSSPLAGLASLSRGGSTLGQVSVSGFMTLKLPVPDGVTRGSDVIEDEGSFQFSFDPGANSVAIEKEVSGGTDLGKIQYGEITGKVTDVDGNKVTGDPITIGGVSFLTDKNGEYNVKGPSGDPIPLRALRGSKSRDVNFTAGSTINQDFQYGGIEFALTLPSGAGIPGVGVTTDATVSRDTTDEDGSVRFSKAEVGGVVNLFVGGFEVVIAGPSGGSVSDAVKRVGTGLRGRVVTPGGEPVANVDVSVQVEDALTTLSDKQGGFKIGTDEAGERTIEFSSADKRFARNEIEVDLQEGDVVENKVVELELQANIGNAV